MEKLTLEYIALKNFKGVKDFTLADIPPEGIRVLGDNESGKTTLYDAFNWLLRGKDSLGRADFEIKTIKKKKTGEYERSHKLDHEVEGSFKKSSGDENIVLRRVFREKWTKKRGSTKKEFTGHETKYYINGVPATEKAYRAKVETIIDETLFHLLSDPLFFNEGLAWKERRNLIMEMGGKLSPEDIASADPAFGEITTFLAANNITVEDWKKILNERRRKINEDIKEIPARIDELNNSLPEEEDLTALQEELVKCRASLKTIKDKASQEQTARLSARLSGGSNAQDITELEDAKGQLQQAINRHGLYCDNEKDAIEDQIKRKKNTIVQNETRLQDIQQTLKEISEFIYTQDLKAEELRNEWHELSKQEFDDQVQTKCPTCERDYEKEDIEKARAEAKTKWNQQKAARLAAIQQEGKAIVENVANQKGAKISDLTEERKKLVEDNVHHRESIDKLVGQVRHFVDLRETGPENKAELEKIVAAKQEVVDLANSKVEAEPDVVEDKYGPAIADLESTEGDLQSRIIAQQTRARASGRLDELDEQEKSLAADFEETERLLDLIGKFEIAEVNLIEGKINDLFSVTTWRLFEQQINGGINPVCIALHKGVPWNSMNNGARVNTGLDCINALSNHFGVSVPIWIDNSESVTKYIDTEAQLIKLEVSAGTKKLETA